MIGRIISFRFLPIDGHAPLGLIVVAEGDEAAAMAIAQAKASSDWHGFADAGPASERLIELSDLRPGEACLLTATTNL